MASSDTAVCAVPSDYSALFLEYGKEIKRVVWRQLGPDARREDVDDGVSYIFQQFVKNDVIAKFDQGHVSEFNGRPVKFRAYVMAWVALYCRGLRDTQRRHAREPLLVDQPVSEDGAVRLVDLLGGTSDAYPSLGDGAAMERLRAGLAARVPAPGSSPVLPLFDALAERFADGKSVLPGAVRQQFGKTTAEVNAWFEELKTALAEVSAARPAAEDETIPGSRQEEAEATAWFRKLYETSPRRYGLGGLVLSVAQVRAAVAALRAARGNRVLPAFKDACHPLETAGKTWYLAFADDVMENWPDLRTPKGRHADGHFGRVKAALIYGLERLVDGVPAGPVPAPVREPAVDLWAELEAVMARLPGFTGENVEAAMAAVRLLELV